MGYLATSVIAALAMSISVFNTTGSMLLAFLAYSLTGSLLLLSVLLCEAVANRGEAELENND